MEEEYRENIRVPEDADRDFVAGAFIVKDGKVLFLDHKKYGFWLPQSSARQMTC